MLLKNVIKALTFAYGKKINKEDHNDCQARIWLSMTLTGHVVATSIGDISLDLF